MTNSKQRARRTLILLETAESLIAAAAGDPTVSSCTIFFPDGKTICLTLPEARTLLATVAAPGSVQ